MRSSITASALLVLALPSTVLADAEDTAMARLRLTTDSSMTRGCTRLASVRDDSLKDLRKKVVKAGGDTALLSFAQDDLSRISADVFNCAGASTPSATPRPAAEPAAPTPRPAAAPAAPAPRPAASTPSAAPRPAAAPAAPAEPPLWQPRSK